MVKAIFYYRPSSNPAENFRSIAIGVAGDRPLYGDFDGDGKLDAAVYRSASSTFFILKSSNNQVTQTDVRRGGRHSGSGGL